DPPRGVARSSHGIPLRRHRPERRGQDDAGASDRRRLARSRGDDHAGRRGASSDRALSSRANGYRLHARGSAPRPRAECGGQHPAAGVGDPAAGGGGSPRGHVPLARRQTTQVSGGQQKIVALARAITGGTRLLLLDEPLEGVAPALAERISDVIGGLKRLGVSALVAESDTKALTRALDRVY